MASLRERIGNWLLGGTKTNPVNRSIVAFRAGMPQWSSDDAFSMATEGYQLNIYAYKSTKIVAQSVAGLNWQVFKKNKRGKREELDAHPLLDILKRPNPEMAKQMFFEALESFRIISGNSFIIAAGPSGDGRVVGLPRELWLLRPDRTRPIAGSGFVRVQAYEYRAHGGAPQVFDPEVVCHIREFHPTDDFFGLSVFRPGARSIDIDNNGRAWNKALLENGANPSLIMKTEDVLDKEVFDHIGEQFDSRWGGPKNAGKIKILEGGLEVEKTSWSPKDMEWSESAKRTAREIALTIGVPPELVGDSENKTYSNVKEARKALYTDTVLPRAYHDRDELNAFLQKWWPDIELDIDLDDIEVLREDRQQLWTGLDASFANGTITRNEVREGKGYDEDPFDYYLVPLGPQVVQIGETPWDTAEKFAINDVAEDDGPDTTQEGDPTQEPSGPKAPPIKSFGLNTRAKKVAFAKAFGARRDRWMRSVAQAASKVLKKQQGSIVDNIRASANKSNAMERVNAAITQHQADWKKFLRNVYLTVGRDFAESTLKGFKSQVSAMPMRPGSSFERKAISFMTKADAEVMDQWQKSVDEWIKENAFDKVEGLSNTDRERLRKQMLEAVSGEESIPDLAARIDTYLEETYANRAMTVARTETIAASNLGSQEAAKATGLDLTKSWLESGDDAVRDDHIEAAVVNQNIPIDQPYEVGGYKLMFPGDSSLGADASETVNCRCSETYDVAEGSADA